MLRVSTLVLLICIIIDNFFNFDKILLPTLFLVVNTFFFLLISAQKKGRQKQVKKKAFKINAIIEDVGLNED